MIGTGVSPKHEKQGTGPHPLLVEGALEAVAHKLLG